MLQYSLAKLLGVLLGMLEALTDPDVSAEDVDALAIVSCVLIDSLSGSLTKMKLRRCIIDAMKLKASVVFQ
jgi:hypothetical protein